MSVIDFTKWKGKGPAHGHLVQPHLKLVIFLPENVDGRGWHANRALVGLPQLIHLLLVLPVPPSNLARAAPNELNIVLPYPPRVLVDANSIDHKLIRLVNNLSGPAIRVVVQVVSPANVVEVDGPEAHVRREHEAAAEKLLGLDEVVEA